MRRVHFLHYILGEDTNPAPSSHIQREHNKTAPWMDVDGATPLLLHMHAAAAEQMRRVLKISDVPRP